MLALSSDTPVSAEGGVSGSVTSTEDTGDGAGVEPPPIQYPRPNMEDSSDAGCCTSDTWAPGAVTSATGKGLEACPDPPVEPSPPVAPGGADVCCSAGVDAATADEAGAAVDGDEISSSVVTVVPHNQPNPTKSRQSQ